MPLTFPAHQGLILPIVRKWPDSFDALALSVGAAMPDITDSVLGFLLNGYFKQWYGHALLGIFTLDLLGGLFIIWLIAIFATRFLNYTSFPKSLQKFFSKEPSDNDSTTSRNIPLRWPSRLRLWSFSVFVGTLSHVGFDLISHDTNLLFYPWYENPPWLPSWWYTTWFEIGPLAMFGHSYSVGIFTVSWCILSFIGVLLFFRFLSPKRENKVRFSLERRRMNVNGKL